MSKDPMHIDNAAEIAKAEAEKARQEADELEQLALQRAARKITEKADIEPKDLITDEDLNVLKIG